MTSARTWIPARWYNNIENSHCTDADEVEADEETIDEISDMLVWIEMDLKVGDTVIYAKYGGTEIKIDDDELIILRESDILAKK